MKIFTEKTLSNISPRYKMCTETLERAVSTLSQITVKKGNVKEKPITRVLKEKDPSKKYHCKVVHKFCVGFFF